MRIIHAGEPIPAGFPLIFLAGPTPRDAATPSWRPEALDTLRRLGWTGGVLVPEPWQGFVEGWDYDGQVRWEWDGLDAAHCIAFWIPRDLSSLPGFTTNIELGMMAPTNRSVLGFPLGAAKMSYPAALAQRFGMFVYDGLEPLLKGSMSKAEKVFRTQQGAMGASGAGLPRQTEILVRTPWVELRRVTAPELGVKGIDYLHETRSGGRLVAVLPYRTGPTGLSFLLRKEFNPSWSLTRTFHTCVTGGVEHGDPERTAVEEIKEEAGYSIDVSRLKHLGRFMAYKGADSLYDLYAADISGLEALAPSTLDSVELRSSIVWASDPERIADDLLTLAIVARFRAAGIA
jgi:8-oxo-dGTP pyrophosphatase MutT (NUDIX family)